MVALWVRRRWLAFPVLYAAVFCAVQVLAPLTGRVPLPCFGDQLRMQSPLYCVTLRNFVTPELAEVAHDVAQDMDQMFPGTTTLALDGGFPFLDDFPLLPHLSHDDGRKLDLALFYQDEGGAFLNGKTRSWIGYWGFESLTNDPCHKGGLSLRWGMAWLQPLWPDRAIEPKRTAALIRSVAKHGKVRKVLFEPDLVRRLQVAHAKVRFQGCRAARHDDHVHLQI